MGVSTSGSSNRKSKAGEPIPTKSEGQIRAEGDSFVRRRLSIGNPFEVDEMFGQESDPVQTV